MTAILESLISGTAYEDNKARVMEIGIQVLPHFPKDTTDRNRTSPFAFTGNKFEFRMVGSSQSIADPNTILNTIVAEELKEFADVLEKTDDFNTTINNLIKENIKKHKRIIFNGDGYAQEWQDEAAKRGLYNLKTAVEAIPYYISKKNVQLLTSHKILTEAEIHSRYEVSLETYSKIINIEALTMLDISKKEILPAVGNYTSKIAKGILAKKSVSEDINTNAEKSTLAKISSLCDMMYKSTDALDEALLKVKECGDALETATYYRDTIIPIMQELRCASDQIETNVAEDVWPFPTYGDLLFKV